MIQDRYIPPYEVTILKKSAIIFFLLVYTFFIRIFKYVVYISEEQNDDQKSTGIKIVGKLLYFFISIQDWPQS